MSKNNLEINRDIGFIIRLFLSEKIIIVIRMKIPAIIRYAICVGIIVLSKSIAANDINPKAKEARIKHINNITIALNSMVNFSARVSLA